MAEDMCWAGVSLIPKGEGGKPLDMRPITVTSIIYRLWAGIRVRQSAAWQAQWLHKGQHGGRPGHSTSEALVGVTLAFEKAILNGEPLTGIAIDLAKAFDNVPQEIMFEVLRAFGADSGLLQGMRAMYEQINRRFKIGRYVGAEFRATNGILQGCPLSVMMLNALMAVLHLALDEVGVYGESYVDDLTILDGATERLQAAIDEMAAFMDLTDQRVNEAKTKAFGTDGDPGLVYKGVPLKFTEEVKLLGVRLRFAEGAAHFKYTDDVVERLIDLMSRIRHAGFPFHQRGMLVAGLVGSRLAYGSEVLDLTAAQEKRLRVAAGRAVWQKRSTQRAPGLLLTLFVKGHVTDPAQILHVRRMGSLQRLVRMRPELRQDLLAVWGAKRQRVRLRGAGPVANLVHSTRRLGLHRGGDDLTFQTCEGDVDMEAVPPLKWHHIAREHARRMVWLQVEKDRARSGNASGMASGIDRTKTLCHYARAPASTQGILRKILLGAVWTQTLRAKMPGIHESTVCQKCSKGCAEDLRHLWWDCPAWDHLRLTRLQGVTEGRSRCFERYGIATVEEDADIKTVVAMHKQLVRIFIARFRQ